MLSGATQTVFTAIGLVLCAVSPSGDLGSAAEPGAAGAQHRHSGGGRIEIQAAEAKLDSAKSEDVIAGARVIAASSDDAAWKKLRTTIVNPKVLVALEKRKFDPGFEGAPYRFLYADLAALLKAVAQGQPDRAPGALMWLVDHKEFRETYTRDESGKPWRAHLAYEAFQYLHETSPELLAFYARRLDRKTPSFLDALKNRIMEALAAHGTPESLGIFKKHLWTYGKPIVLIKHRDRYECVRLLLSLYRGATNATAAHRMLGRFLQDSYQEMRWHRRIPLPAIRPKGEEVEKFVKLFQDFLKDPGKIPLTDEEKSKFRKLIAEIQKQNRPTPKPPRASRPGSTEQTSQAPTPDAPVVRDDSPRTWLWVAGAAAAAAVVVSLALWRRTCRRRGQGAMRGRPSGVGPPGAGRPGGEQ